MKLKFLKYLQYKNNGDEMGYTAEEQDIDKPTEQLIESIKVWKRMSENRRNDETWNDEHIHELIDIKKDLLDIELKLRHLI